MHWLADSLRYRRSTTANSYLDAKQLKAGKTTNPNPDPENLSTKEKAKAKSAKTANQVTTGFGVESEAEIAKRSICEPFREDIELGLSRGRDATAIWQDLVSESGFGGGYQTVKRYVRKLRGNQHGRSPGQHPVLLMDGVSCRLIVQRRCTSCCLPVENIPFQAEHHSGRRAKVFAFRNGMLFGFTAESRSPSSGFRARRKMPGGETGRGRVRGERNT